MLDTNSDLNLVSEANPGNFDQNFNENELFPTTTDSNTNSMMPADYDTIGNNLTQTTQFDPTIYGLENTDSIDNATDGDTDTDKLLGGDDNQMLAGETDSLQGLWKSDGYGYIFEVKGDELSVFDVTKNNFTPNFTGNNVDQTPGDGEVDFEVDFRSAILELKIKSTTDDDVKIIDPGGDSTDITLQRIDEKPSVSEQPTSNDPLTNFDVFWDTFAENYAMFPLKDVDWSAVKEQYRSQVTSETTPEQLFEILSSAIEPLNDAHTSITAEDIGKTFNGERDGTDYKALAQKSEQIKGITDQYLAEPLQFWGNGNISYGKLDSGAGYLRIDSFGGYTDSGKFSDDLTELNTALDTIFSQPEQPENLVIDLRLNGGGLDELGLEIASRLTDKPYLAYTGIARNDPNDPSQFTDSPFSATVQPNDKPGFSGDVTLLTSRYTISAAEAFTESLIGREDVVRVGETTQGVFSTVLNKTLPNGWKFGLGNQLVFNEEGQTFETEGIPADVQVPVFTDEDLANGRDSAIEKTEEILAA
jgi:C-terminal processing protease CtpA/Prc